jgi:GDP-4-dehydro-6-deoxy-D-mannose reductase
MKREDLLSKKTIRNFFDLNPPSCNDFLIHLACAGVNSSENFIDSIEFNFIRTIDLLYISYKFGINRYVFIGSCFEYGLTGNDQEFLNEYSILNPCGSYSTSKVICYYALKEFFRMSDAQCYYLRLFQVYGESEAKGRLYRSLISAAINGEDFLMSDGSQIRDFIHINNVVIYIYNLIKSSTFKRNFNTLNVCSGIPTSVRSFAEFHWNRLNANGKLIFGEINKKDNFNRLVGSTVIRDNEKLDPFYLYTNI